MSYCQSLNPNFCCGEAVGAVTACHCPNLIQLFSTVDQTYPLLGDPRLIWTTRGLPFGSPFKLTEPATAVRQVTLTQDGWYRINYSLSIVAASAPPVTFSIIVRNPDGTIKYQFDKIGIVDTTVADNVMLLLQRDDTVEIRFTSGGTVTVNDGATFGIQLL